MMKPHRDVSENPLDMRKDHQLAKDFLHRCYRCVCKVLDRRGWFGLVDVDDAASSLALKLLGSEESTEAAIRNPGWLFTAAKNHVSDLRRKEAAHQRAIKRLGGQYVAQDPVGGDPPRMSFPPACEELEANEAYLALEAFKDAVERTLKPEIARVFRHDRRHGRLPAMEAGRALGLGEGTVRVYRARYGMAVAAVRRDFFASSLNGYKKRLAMGTALKLLHEATPEFRRETYLILAYQPYQSFFLRLFGPKARMRPTDSEALELIRTADLARQCGEKILLDGPSPDDLWPEPVPPGVMTFNWAFPALASVARGHGIPPLAREKSLEYWEAARATCPLQENICEAAAYAAIFTAADDDTTSRMIIPETYRHFAVDDIDDFFGTVLFSVKSFVAVLARR